MFRLIRRPRNAVLLAGTAGIAGYYTLVPSSSTPELRGESKRYSAPPLWNPPPRKEVIERLKLSSRNENEVFDLLVVGGGATGAGVALDAVSRGLKVALIEQNDFSSGMVFDSGHMFFLYIDALYRNVVEIYKIGTWRRSLSSKSSIRARLRTVQARQRGITRT
jgi:glycerol-3-phosphate dehydrogenase